MHLPTLSESESAPVRPGRLTQFWKALPVQRSRILLLLASVLRATVIISHAIRPLSRD